MLKYLQRKIFLVQWEVGIFGAENYAKENHSKLENKLKYSLKTISNVTPTVAATLIWISSQIL